MNYLKTLILSVIVASHGAAQSTPGWDTSGNGMLSGSYNFRHVAYLTSNLAGDTSRKVLIHGTMRFDGKGAYELAATQLDARDNDATAATAPIPVTYKGNYALAASGYGYISNPILRSALIYGSVSSGLFIGASTESGFNDLLIAAPAPGSAAYFTGKYQLVGLDVPSGNHKEIRNFRFDLSPNGYGNLGVVSLSGYTAGSASPASDNVTATYSALDKGAGTIQIRGGNALYLSGAQTYYLSPDGNFVFGGSPNSFNFFVGVRASDQPGDIRDFAGLYFQAGLDHDASQILAKNQSVLSSYHGSVHASNGLAINHQRLNALIFPTALEYTFADSYAVQAAGTGSDSFQKYWFGSGGKIRIGMGNYPFLGLSIATKITNAPLPGVYLNPTSIHNAASEAPFTAALSPGQLVEISGANLSSATVAYNGMAAPQILNKVEVLVNGVAAPLMAVSPTKVRFLVPFETRSIAAIQVKNNGVASNTITAFIASTSPGLFTVPAGGTNYVAASHANNTLISTSNPARVGESIQFYLVGLGSVSGHANGASGPVSPLAQTDHKFLVYIDGQAATARFTGLAPNFIGLYQINAIVPPGVRSGEVFVDIAGPDSDTSQAYLSVAAGNGTKAKTSTELTTQRRSAWANRELSELPTSLRSGARAGTPSIEE